MASEGVAYPPANLAALQAQIPVMATDTPPGVADNGTSGGETKEYAGKFHTHASKARKAKVSINTSSYLWTYPTPFDVGVSPICNGIAQVAPGNADLFNVQVIGAPTNTQCTFQINRVSSGLLALLTGALSINLSPATITLHMLALEP